MNRNPGSRILAVAGATAITSLACGGPANAVRVIPPSGGDPGATAIATAAPAHSPDSSWDLTPAGAAGAFAVVGAGAVVLVRRRQSGHDPRPV